MANTYSQIYIQVVFAVKRREKLIPKRHKDELFKFISGVVRNQGQLLLQINGVEDHIHILLAVKPSIKLSDLVRDIKANSSRFINEKGWVPKKFRWQEGFGAFSYSKKELDGVIKYIANQEQHHARQAFEREYLKFLEDFEIDYDPKWVFDG